MVWRSKKWFWNQRQILYRVLTQPDTKRQFYSKSGFWSIMIKPPYGMVIRSIHNINKALYKLNMHMKHKILIKSGLKQVFLTSLNIITLTTFRHFLISYISMGSCASCILFLVYESTRNFWHRKNLFFFNINGFFFCGTHILDVDAGRVGTYKEKMKK